MFVARSESYRHRLQTTHSPKVAVSGAQPKGSRDFRAGAWNPAGRARASSSADRSLGRDMTGRYVIGIDTTCCSVVALDAAGEALRPALIWMDVRSAEQAARVTASGDPSLKVNGDGRGPVAAAW